MNTPKIVISLGETIGQVVLTIDSKPIGCITSINMRASINDLVPTLEIEMVAPTQEMDERTKTTIEEYIAVLQTIPYVKLTLKEMI